ncbi:kinase-like domain-containing protein [Rhizophagus diaphanus]|nr:kinase-like domain-containing protein [Rhizophagus diaphanus] [Rhizophagus sp. MUCL 43196]
MVHRDFHTRNLLISTNNTNNINDNDFNITILDMKLCGEVGNIDETKVYGGMHYTAPEVLSGKSYTQATDIHSFGMIMYFMVTGNYPSDEIKQEEINEPKAPKCYIDLMEKCLDQNPKNRPNNIVDIYEMAEYNKNICNVLIERVELTRVSIELLQIRKLKKEKELRNESYYNAFCKFIYVLEKIKEYVEDISKIHFYRKYSKANSVKEKFIKLTEEYDNIMKDLHFTMAVDSEERRKSDEEALSEDLAEFDKYLRTMSEKVDNDKLNYIKKLLADKTFYGANKIDSKELTLPTRGKSDDKRGKGPNFIVRRILSGQEVACKLTSTTEEEMKTNTSVQEYLKFLMKLSECNHILRFYGVSKIDDVNALVFEWAHYGTLKELYEKKDIQWQYKVQIALKICRGLIFLQKAEILHHDLRCENILMTESLEPKIYNFHLVDYSTDITLSNEAINDIVRWLAPEKLINYKSKYTTQCEIFSFGVLLWELAFEKIPYRSLKVDEIKDFVIKGGREVIKFGNTTPEISKLQEDYKKVINDTWKNNPQERISFLKALNMLEELYNSVSHMFDENKPALLDENTLDLDGSKANDDLVLPDENVSLIIPKISLNEGILAYREGDHQKAWKCFEYHAENGNTVAKYWKGRYLWEGIHDGIKGREEGKELLKIAADEGYPDAQLRYAFTLKNVLGEDDNRNLFMNYITKAAEGNNDTAQYNLGDIYYKGKLNIPKDENEGIKWLKLAALHDNARAIKFLEEKKISFY